MAGRAQFYKIEREWTGETAFIVCGGPSVGYQNTNRLLGRNTIAVNSSYETIPFADFLFFGDRRWFDQHKARPDFVDFKGRIVTVSAAVQDPAGRVLKCERVIPGPETPGFADKPTALASQRTSTQGAMNLAAHLGVRRIVLLGLDMARASDGRSHHHKPHIWQNKPGNKTWDIQMTQLRLIVQPLNERGIEVYNTSPNSRCPFWPKADLESFL